MAGALGERHGWKTEDKKTGQKGICSPLFIFLLFSSYLFAAGLGSAGCVRRVLDLTETRGSRRGFIPRSIWIHSVHAGVQSRNANPGDIIRAPIWAIWMHAGIEVK